VKDLLGIDLGGGIRSTYYLRVTVSLAVGFLAGVVTATASKGRMQASDRTIAWITGLGIAASTMLIVLFPWEADSHSASEVVALLRAAGVDATEVGARRGQRARCLLVATARRSNAGGARCDESGAKCPQLGERARETILVHVGGTWDAGNRGLVGELPERPLGPPVDRAWCARAPGGGPEIGLRSDL
jgi:hypothetical protein